MERLGTGIGWRPELADAVEEIPGVDWVEVVAENVSPGRLPPGLRRLRERGVPVVPHGVGLGLGGAEPPAPARLAALAHLAQTLDAPLVSEHIAFVRAGGPPTGTPVLQAGHLLPVPRTRDALDVLCANVRIARDALPVPLALENIATLLRWPDAELSEARFLGELVERTGVRLLVDVANLHTEHVNHGTDPVAVLDDLPLEALAYVHVAGGAPRDGVWHDDHAHPVPPPVLELLTELCRRADPPGVLLERDDAFPPAAGLAAELDRVRAACAAAGPPAAHRPVRRSGRPVMTGRAAPPGAVPPGPDHGAAAARRRLAAAQAALLATLVADGPAPEGFDRGRLAVQRRALAAKRVAVLAKVAPALPELLGAEYRPAALRHAHARPMTGGYRAAARDFARWLLTERPVRLDRGRRRALRRWLRSPEAGG